MKFPAGITKSARPKMSNHRGRTWDQGRVTLPNGDEIACYYDTTWGTRFYFEIDAQWFVGDISAFDSGKSRYFITPHLAEKAV